MSELTGICRLRSLGNKKDDRKAGILVKSDLLFSVTLDKKIKVYAEEAQVFTEEQFNELYYVVELPVLTLNQRRLNSYKEALSYEKIVGESPQDIKFKIKTKGREEVVSFRQTTRTSALATIIREFKKHDEVYEWFKGDWLLIKRGEKGSKKRPK